MAGIRSHLSGLLIVGAGGLLSWLVIAISFDLFLLAGTTTPATILGAGWDRPAVAGGAGVLLVLAAWRRSWQRVALLALWLAFLGSATHRLLQFADGGIAGIWLILPMQRLPAASAEAEGQRCETGRWRARCMEGAGHGLTSVTPLRFVPLYPGRWTAS